MGKTNAALTAWNLLLVQYSFRGDALARRDRDLQHPRGKGQSAGAAKGSLFCDEIDRHVSEFSHYTVNSYWSDSPYTHCEASKDREQHRSSSPGDLREPRR
jgi:hypothetical protein